MIAKAAVGQQASDPDAPQLLTLAPPRREALRVLAILTVLLVVAYWNVVLTGKSLVYSDNYSPLNPTLTAENYGPGFLAAETWHRNNLILYPNFHDAGAVWWQWEPGAEFLRQGLRRGEAPLWDPYVAGGTPAMANLTQAFFFPPHFLIVLLGNTSGVRNAYYLSVLLCSSFFTYLLLRRHGLALPASLAGGLGYMFSGGMAQHVGSFVGQSAACIPLAVYATRWFLERAGWRRVVVLALCYAAIALASFPPVLVQLFGLAAAYALTMTWCGQAGRGRAQTLAYYGLAVAVALALVAFYYLPAFFALNGSPQALAMYRDAGLIRWIPLSLYQLLSPVLMGGAEVYQAQLIPGMQFYYVPYFGAVGLLWSALADRRGEGGRGPLFVFSSLAALIVTLKIVGVAPIQWLGHLPGFNTIHYAQYHGIGLNFLLAILAAIGVENLLAGRVSRARILSLGGAGIVVACSLLQVASTHQVLQPRINRWLFEWMVLTAFALLAIAVAAAAMRCGPRRGWIAVAALALFFAEGARNTFYPRQVRADIYRRAPRYIRFLQQKSPWSRLYTLGPLPANTNAAFDISSWDSLMTFNPPRSFELYRRYTGTGERLFLRGGVEIPPEPVLDALGIDLLLVRTEDQAGITAAETRSYARAFKDDYVTLFERRGEARCFFTSDFRVAKPGDALELLSRPRPVRQIIVERAPVGLPAAANRPQDRPARLAAAGRNRWRVEVDAPRPGFLYCSENLFAGWAARVNGRAAPILVANHAFRAVRLDPGRNEVEFRYWPPGLTAGLWLSGLGAAALIGAAIYGRP